MSSFRWLRKVPKFAAVSDNGKKKQSITSPSQDRPRPAADVRCQSHLMLSAIMRHSHANARLDQRPGSNDAQPFTGGNVTLACCMSKHTFVELHSVSRKSVCCSRGRPTNAVHHRKVDVAWHDEQQLLSFCVPTLAPVSINARRFGVWVKTALVEAACCRSHKVIPCGRMAAASVTRAQWQSWNRPRTILVQASALHCWCQSNRT